MDDVIPIALNYRSDIAEMRADVIADLSAAQKTMPCRWLYDDRGSELFEEVTRLPEYYPTRIETGMLRKHVFVGEKVNVLEYGAGAGIKT
jgi:L-histidine Nalpha-methyltransferase